MKIELGMEVKDRVTGFQGIVVHRITFLNGCDRMGVQPKVSKKEMELPEVKSFDEPDLEFVANGLYEPPEKPVKEKKPGGPHGHDFESR